MLRSLAVLLLSTLPVLADPVPFREIVELEGERFTIPMTVSLVAADETEVVLGSSPSLPKSARSNPA